MDILVWFSDHLINGIPWLASWHMCHGPEWAYAFTGAVPRAKSRFNPFDRE